MKTKAAVQTDVVRFNCTPQFVMYRKDTFIILKVLLEKELLTPDDEPIQEVIVIGNSIPDIRELITVTGSWEYSSKYQNWQIKALTAVMKLPTTTEGIEAYLSSGLIKGIGKKTAKAIVKRFGEQTFEIIEKDPDALLEIRGISKRRLKVIVEHYTEQVRYRDLIAECVPLGVSPKMAIKLSQSVKNLPNVLKTQPFSLCHKGLGFGYRTADAISMKMGLPSYAPERYTAAIEFVLKENEQNGNCYMPIREMLKTVQELTWTKEIGEMCAKFAIPEQVQYKAILNALHKSSSGTCLNPLFAVVSLEPKQYAVYRWTTRELEIRVAKRIKTLQSMKTQSVTKKEAIDRMNEAIQTFGIKPAKEQVNAIQSFIEHPVTIMTGYPGTGKTTTLRLVLEVFGSDHVLLCAPTGRAARRMSEQTGRPAMTIHKALFSGNFESEATYNPLKPKDEPIMGYDAVIIDEASMIDLHLAYRLFQAIHPGTKVLLVGDPHQLPSVGAGNVLHDLIASKTIPVVRLNRIFRQKDTSTVAINAEKIRNGDSKLEYQSDFEFIEAETDEETVEAMVDLYLKALDRIKNPDQVVCLSPFRQRSTGSIALNERIRNKVNPIEPGEDFIIESAGKRFHIQDRVMQTKNTQLWEATLDDQSLVNNGDTGTIVDVFEEDGLKAEVEFNGIKYILEPSDFLTIDLAYAMTIHKSQGSEYEHVIMCLKKSHYIMLKRNLVYTGMTRATKNVQIVGQRRALHIGIQTEETKVRTTRLIEELQS
ncbi:MAG: AAA family ATPase [Fastidiosipilaceae bacterium]|jgi:exodeoxyribonuclease V alpha subunit